MLMWGEIIVIAEPLFVPKIFGPQKYKLRNKTQNKVKPPNFLNVTPYKPSAYLRSFHCSNDAMYRPFLLSRKPGFLFPAANTVRTASKFTFFFFNMKSWFHHVVIDSWPTLSMQLRRSKAPYAIPLLSHKLRYFCSATALSLLSNTDNSPFWSGEEIFKQISPVVEDILALKFEGSTSIMEDPRSD